MPLIKENCLEHCREPRGSFTRGQVLATLAFILAIAVGTGLIVADKVLTEQGNAPRGDYGVLGVCVIIFAVFAALGGTDNRAER